MAAKLKTTYRPELYVVPDDEDDDFYGTDDATPKYTLEEYIAYLRAPQWVLDGCLSRSQYESELCAKVRAWYDESKDAFRNEKEVYALCYERLNAGQRSGIRSATIIEEGVAAAMFPITRNAMIKEIAALYAGQYAPVYKALSDGAVNMVALANKFLKIELTLNNWDTKKFKLGLDGFVADLWCVKLYTDNQDPGPFGEDKRIVINRVDPMRIYPDPKAEEWDWSLMDYFIHEESLDIGVARRRFPSSARRINMNLAEPDSQAVDRYPSSQLMVLNGQKKQWQSGIERQRIQIKECWLHDERTRFRGFEEAYVDENGNNKSRVMLDEDGYVIGAVEPAYPYGRLIVTASDRIVLEDIANPYWHGGIPYVFCPMGPSCGKLMTVGKAAAILGIERKINDTETRVHSYMQSEVERPMVMQVGAMPTNAQWFALNNRARAIIMINKGYEIYRPEPVEIPAFVGPYLSRLQEYKNDTLGISGVLQGDIPEGAQISAEGIQQVQGIGQGPLNMESTFVGVAMKEVGDKFLYLMRQTYKEDGLVANVFDPAGNPITVPWNADTLESGNEYYTEIDLAANQPGGQQAILDQAIKLKREGLADRPYCLAASGINDWQVIDQRMTQAKLEEITTVGVGKELGATVKKEFKDDQGPTEKGANYGS